MQYREHPEAVRPRSVGKKIALARADPHRTINSIYYDGESQPIDSFLFFKQTGRDSTPIPCFLRRAPSAFFPIPALQMLEPH